METPEGDAAEQYRDANADEATETEELHEIPDEVDAADAAEQTRDVGYDDEDYR